MSFCATLYLVTFLPVISSGDRPNMHFNCCQKSARMRWNSTSSTRKIPTLQWMTTQSNRKSPSAGSRPVIINVITAAAVSQ